MIILLAAVLALFGVQRSTDAAEPKLAQTGFQFLSIPTEARASAMGDAFTAVAGGSMSIFYNPANLARGNALLDFSLSQNQWIADINHFSGSLSFNPANGKYGTFGFSLLSVDYGEFLFTRVNPNSERGYDNLDYKNMPTAYAVGVAYSKALTDQFSFGIHAKYTAQDLGVSEIPDPQNEGSAIEKDYNIGVMAFDFGTVYNTGYKSLTFAMSVRNFSQEVKYETEGFQLPLNFHIGVAMDMMDIFDPESKLHSFLLAVEATHPRDQPEQLRIGGEYLFLDVLALRAGYNSNLDERDISLGFGLKKDFGRRGGKIALDYAYTPFGVFDNVQRFSFSLAL